MSSLWVLGGGQADGPMGSMGPMCSMGSNSDFVAFLYRNSDLPSWKSYTKMTRSRNSRRPWSPWSRWSRWSRWSPWGPWSPSWKTMQPCIGSLLWLSTFTFEVILAQRQRYAAHEAHEDSRHMRHMKIRGTRGTKLPDFFLFAPGGLSNVEG